MTSIQNFLFLVPDKTIMQVLISPLGHVVKYHCHGGAYILPRRLGRLHIAVKAGIVIPVIQILHQSQHTGGLAGLPGSVEDKVFFLLYQK